MYMLYVILLFLKVFKVQTKTFHETELNFSIVTEKKICMCVFSVQFVSNIVIWARRWNKHVMTIWPKLEGIFFRE